MAKKQPTVYRVVYRSLVDSEEDGIQASRIDTLEEAVYQLSVCHNWFNDRKIPVIGHQGPFDILLEEKKDPTQRVECWIEQFVNNEWKRLDEKPLQMKRASRSKAIAGTNVPEPEEVPA